MCQFKKKKKHTLRTERYGAQNYSHNNITVTFKIRKKYSLNRQ